MHNASIFSSLWSFMYLRPERDPEDYLLSKVILLSVDKTKMPSTLFSYQINTDIKQPTGGRCTEQHNNDIGNILTRIFPTDMLSSA